MEKKVTLWDAFPIYGYEKQALFSKEMGCITIPLKLELPEVYTLDVGDYARLKELFFNIINILGPHKILHRQDYFLEDNYTPIPQRLEGDFLERANEYHFENRPILKGYHYMFLSMVPKNYLKLNSKRVNSFLKKPYEHYFLNKVPKDFLDNEVLHEFEGQVKSVDSLINNSGLIKSSIVSFDDLFSEGGIYSKYFGLSKTKTNVSDINFSDNSIWVGEKKAQFFTVENLEQFTKDHIGTNEFFGKFTTVSNPFPIGNLFSLGFKLPYEHIINQYIYIPDQDKALAQLRKKAKRFNQFAGRSKDDSNTIYANQIYDYTKDILENHKDAVFYHLNMLGFGEGKEDHRLRCNTISSAFKKLRINVKQNYIDRKNLFFGGVPGNSVGISSDMYMPMSSDMASSLLYFEGGYKDSSATVNGIRLVDRITGRPFSVSLYKEPEEMGMIFNRGMLVASGSGGGKSFFVNHYLASELRQGAEAVIMEDGNSYDRLTEVFDGVILQHDDNRPFTFNPFLLDEFDFISTSQKGKKLSESKILNLVTLLKLIIGEGKNTNAKEVEKTILELMVVGYYESMWADHNCNFKFDTFYTYCNNHLKETLKTRNISKEVFDCDVFLFLLEKYESNGSRGNLLNNLDSRICNLSDRKVVYFKLNKLIDNELLFPITALMIMDIFNKKMHDSSKLSINKILTVDEAWKALDRPELVHYFNGQSRKARKLGGQPIFISQKVDDFIASKIIKDAIIVNSHIKVFLDMRDFANSFEKIQAIMGLGEKQRQLILSINKDLPKNRKLREVAICWMDKTKVYGIETSLEEKCIYETNPVQSEKIRKHYENNQNNWELTAKAYAHKNR